MATEKKGKFVKRKIFECPRLPCEEVTVYTDNRAEVKRLVACTLKTGVTNEIVIKKLPYCVDKDSIRVEGKGHASICEVQYQEKQDVKKTKIKGKEKNVSKDDQRLEELKENRDKVSAEKQLLQTQRLLLYGVAEQIGGGPIFLELQRKRQEQEKKEEQQEKEESDGKQEKDKSSTESRSTDDEKQKSSETAILSMNISFEELIMNLNEGSNHSINYYT